MTHEIRRFFSKKTKGAEEGCKEQGHERIRRRGKKNPNLGMGGPNERGNHKDVGLGGALRRQGEKRGRVKCERGFDELKDRAKKK